MYDNIKIGLIGYQGRMGQAIIRVLQKKNIKTITNGGDVENSDKSKLFQSSDVIIDFSSPDGLLECLQLAVQFHKPLVSGTTPIDQELMKKITDASKHTRICWSSNMSIGIAIIKKMAAMCATMLPDYDCEILDKHHNKKKDAPSGTAIAIGQVIANCRNINFDENKICNRNCIRQQDQIGFASIRGGNIFGEHDVMFIGENDEITISHKAYNRELFAAGAVKCALKILEKQTNGFYSVEDLLL